MMMNPSLNINKTLTKQLYLRSLKNLSIHHTPKKTCRNPWISSTPKRIWVQETTLSCWLMSRMNRLNFLRSKMISWDLLHQCLPKMWSPWACLKEKARRQNNKNYIIQEILSQYLLNKQRNKLTLRAHSVPISIKSMEAAITSMLLLLYLRATPHLRFPINLYKSLSSSLRILLLT